jgi:O-antigen/teichoic acid export membrane protein
MVIVVSAVIINYALNAYLIPRDGIMGAATASLITNVLVGIGYIVAAWPFFRQWTLGFRSLIPVCLVVLLGFVLWDYRAVSMWYSLPLLAAAYSLVFYYIGYSKEERSTVFAGLLR